MTAAAWRRAARALCREAPAFVLVGGLGFLTQAALLVLLVRWAGMDPYPAWFPAFAVAVALTYGLNRGWTFAHRAGPDRPRELARYAVTQGLGAVANNAVHGMALWIHPSLRAEPVLALAAGSLAAMALTYVAARQLAFTGSKGPAAGAEPGARRQGS